MTGEDNHNSSEDKTDCGRDATQTATSEEIEDWNAEHDRPHPVFSVDHRPERDSLDIDVPDDTDAGSDYDDSRVNTESDSAISRCEVCGGSTTKTALPVFDETLRLCDRCQRGVWRELTSRWGTGE